MSDLIVQCVIMSVLPWEWRAETIMVVAGWPETNDWEEVGETSAPWGVVITRPASPKVTEIKRDRREEKWSHITKVSFGSVKSKHLKLVTVDNVGLKSVLTYFNVLHATLEVSKQYYKLIMHSVLHWHALKTGCGCKINWNTQVFISAVPQHTYLSASKACVTGISSSHSFTNDCIGVF